MRCGLPILFFGGTHASHLQYCLPSCMGLQFFGKRPWVTLYFCFFPGDRLFKVEWLEQQGIASAVTDLSDRGKAGKFAIPGRWLWFRGEARTGCGVNDVLVHHVGVLKLGCAFYVLLGFFLLSCCCVGFRCTLIFHLNRGSMWWSLVRNSRVAILVFGLGFDLRGRSSGFGGHCKGLEDVRGWGRGERMGAKRCVTSILPS